MNVIDFLQNQNLNFLSTNFKEIINNNFILFKSTTLYNKFFNELLGSHQVACLTESINQLIDAHNLIVRQYNTYKIQQDETKWQTFFKKAAVLPKPLLLINIQFMRKILVEDYTSSTNFHQALEQFNHDLYYDNLFRTYLDNFNKFITENNEDEIKEFCQLILGQTTTDLYKKINSKEIFRNFKIFNEDLRNNLLILLSDLTVVPISWNDVFEIIANSDKGKFIQILQNLNIDINENTFNQLLHLKCLYDRHTQELYII